MIDYLVGDFVHQLLVILHTCYLPFIVGTDKYLSALGIGKTAYPLEIFVPPGLFIFDILIFGQKLLELRGAKVNNQNHHKKENFKRESDWWNEN